MADDKELFLRKSQQKTWEEWDAACEQKSPGFKKARETGDFEACFYQLCQNMNISLNLEPFVYFFDFDFYFCTSISNITPDYSKILSQGICSLYYEKDDCTNEFCKRYNAVLSCVELLIHRIIEELGKRASLLREEGASPEVLEHVEKQIHWFENMKTAGAETFEEALQRILFLNQLIWQTGSRLVGLGRLDMMLYPYYRRDVMERGIAEEQIVQAVHIFLHILHRDYWYKSSVLLGDTGQIIILGGVNQDGIYEVNDLTYQFLQAVKTCRLSDPKVVLRTSRGMPEELMRKAVECMATGIGSPLLSNDDVVIPTLLTFGVEKEDAYCYTTSACWEPLIGGKSSSMNNQCSLVYTEALYAMLMEEPLRRLNSYEAVKKSFFQYLRQEVIKCQRLLYFQKQQRNTLYSIFMEGCRESRKDITEGGAKYHNIGMTTVGLGNVVDALLNIERCVFQEKIYSLVDVKKICFYNYDGYPEAAGRLAVGKKYGKDEDDAAALANEIQRFVSSLTVDFRTAVGGKLKFGASSPAYIMAGATAEASFDGRKKGDPFIVHISNESVSSYTELLCFAAALDYAENRFNGNVVDLMVNPSFMELHLEKFTQLLLRGTEVGYFQLQTNVVSSDVLMEAKQSPEKFGSLIVRVWGFSAYFVELPESYQDLLIQRALQNEGKTA